MKKLTLILSFTTLCIIAFTACQPKNKDEKTEATESVESISNEPMATTQYTCPMHPEIITDAPGKCPKCGMDLVKKESANVEMEHMNTDSTMHE